MKKIVLVAVALTALNSSMALARPFHHHHHPVCTMMHHHRVCR